ncbi:hypothetical protein HPB48_019340 [Haemaphysalis longicornis]|uniref:CCHC-type domain-containing protein n=1 Tax=Haemaphysalis longicornis TaxID=44386 RepID=A0A9J6GN26_HAELO|nr:hypothetical protein HPB48_019340 [Haemaphysalis longicornis]
MEMRMDNPVPNFLRVSGQRAAFDYRRVRKVCRWCGLEGHFKAQCATPRCERCVVFAHVTEGCVRNCSWCGGTHATADCTARKSYSMVTTGGFSAAFPPLQELRENGDQGRSRAMKVHEDDETTPETTDDTRSEDTEEVEENRKTQHQTAATTEAKGATSEDGTEAPAGAREGQDGGRGEDGRHDSSSRAVLRAESRKDGEGEDGRQDDSNRTVAGIGKCDEGQAAGVRFLDATARWRSCSLSRRPTVWSTRVSCNRMSHRASLWDTRFNLRCVSFTSNSFKIQAIMQ